MAVFPIFDRKGGDATASDVAITISIVAGVLSIFAAYSTYRLNKMHAETLKDEIEQKKIDDHLRKQNNRK